MDNFEDNNRTKLYPTASTPEDGPSRGCMDHIYTIDEPGNRVN